VWIIQEAKRQPNTITITGYLLPDDGSPGNWV
jgi:hypothetical protein